MRVPGLVMVLAAPAFLLLSACSDPGADGGDGVTAAPSDAGGMAAAPSTTSPGVDAAIPESSAPPSDPAADAPNTSGVAGNLSAYVGKWPFDEVGGVTWNDNPVVAAGIRNTVTDAAVRKAITQTGGPASEISMYNGKVASWSCEQHNCGDHQWDVMVDPKSGATDVCYYNAAQLADKSRWFLASGKVETRDGNCSVT